ncbi:MAG: helix-turn-helix transcriptional regulator [Geminicoccaceae bacterium]
MHLSSENRDFMIKVRNHLISRRKELGLSQADLAEILGVTQQQVSRIENGTRKLHGEWAQILSQALQLTPEQVMFGESRRHEAKKSGVLTSAEVVEIMQESDAEPEICPAWLPPETALQMVEVVTNTLEPRLFLGDQLFFDATESKPEEIINQECLAILPDQSMVIRRVEKRQDGPGVILRGYRSATPILFPIIGTGFFRLVGIKPKQ